MIRSLIVLVILLVVYLAKSSSGPAPAPDDLPSTLSRYAAPDDPLSSFSLHPGFQIELIASEPLVADPIDMEIDEYGRMYVLEFHSYPSNWTGVDRIVQLRDSDGDGRMDERILFVDSLAQAMGIMRWQDGLIVAAPPDVLYLEDSDGDGRADIRQVLLTGFHHGDGESDVNNPTYAIDNGIYLGNGPRSDSDIYFPERPDGQRIPADATNRNVRFRPDTYELEAQSGRTQYGLTFDAWGHPLFTNNRNHVYEEVIAARYLARNPGLLVSNATASISDHGAATQVFPITENPEYQILTDVGEITSACGITYYDGGLFPDAFDGVSFVAEPAHNLVHVDRIRRSGAALIAERVRPHVEFLASRDARFRPVNLYVGPDGALYLVDYYRTIIEGPTWLADEVLESGRLYEGTEKGRIYRITPEGTGPAAWTRGLSLGDASNEELVAHLADPNSWWRINAQRLLVDRSARDVISDLESLAKGTSEPGRLHALWTLEGLGALRPELIHEALRDVVPGIRENAIRLAERRLGGRRGDLDSGGAAVSMDTSGAQVGADANDNDAQSLVDALLAMRSDPDARVRFQLLLTLGEIDTPRAAEVRDALLFQDIEDEWVQIAALTSTHVEPASVLDAVIGQYKSEYASFTQRLAALVAANGPADQVSELVSSSIVPGEGDPTWQVAVLQGIAQGIPDRDQAEDAADRDRADGDAAGPANADLRLPVASLERALFDHPAEDIRAAALSVLQAHGHPPETDEAKRRAVDIAGDIDAAVPARVRAIDFLLLGDAAENAALWSGLIDPEQPAEVQAAAFRALGKVTGTEVSRLAIREWPVLTSAVRDAALDGILDYPFDRDRIVMLLEAIERRVVNPAGIGWGHKVTLMRDIPDDLKFRARDLITAAEANVRRETAAFIRVVAEQTPDPERGRAVFSQQCARCHALGEIAAGASVGPDLMSVRSWEEADLIDQILQPNKAIARGFELWRVTLESGDVVEGMIASEAAHAITLRDEYGRETTISRQSIAGLQDLGAGVMPADFGERISHQEMADLVAFIRVGQ